MKKLLIVLLGLSIVFSTACTSKGNGDIPAERLSYLNLSAQELQKKEKLNPLSIHKEPLSAAAPDCLYGSLEQDVYKALGYTGQVDDAMQSKAYLTEGKYKLMLEKKTQLMGKEAVTAMAYDGILDMVNGLEYYVLLNKPTEADFAYVESLYNYLDSTYESGSPGMLTELKGESLAKSLGAWYAEKDPKVLEEFLNTNIKLDAVAAKPMGSASLGLKDSFGLSLKILRPAKDTVLVIIRYKLQPQV